MRDGELVGTGTCSDGVGVPGVGVDWAVPRGLAEDGLGRTVNALCRRVNEARGVNAKFLQNVNRTMDERRGC